MARMLRPRRPLSLEALATPRASQLASKWCAPSEAGSGREIESVRVEDGVVRWDHEGALCWPRCKDSPLNATIGLARHALDPNVELDPTGRSALTKVARETSARQFWCDPQSRGSGDLGLEMATAPLARWAPREFNDLIRRIMREATERDDRQALKLARKLRGLLPVLTEPEFVALRQLAIRISPAAQADEKAREARRLLQMAELAGHDASGQMDVLIAARSAYLPIGFRELLMAPPQPEDFTRLANLLDPRHPHEHLQGWLAYLHYAPPEHMPDDFPPLVALLSSEDSLVRARALEAIRVAGKPGLFRALASSNWRWSPEMDSHEASRGCFALCHASRFVKVPELLERIPPKYLALLIILHPENNQLLDAYERYLLGLIRDLPVQGTADRCPLAHKAGPLKALMRRRSDALIAALNEIVSHAPEGGGGCEEYPVRTAIGVLLEAKAPEGLRLWRDLYPIMSTQGIAAKIRKATFLCTDDPSARALCAHLLATAENDGELSEFANWAVEHGQCPWLVDQIEEFFEGAAAADIARGLTIAGCLPPASEAASLWSVKIDKLPLLGWLGELRVRAKQRWQAGLFADHWFGIFLDSSDSETAFPAYRLFCECADNLAWNRARRRLYALYSDQPTPEHPHWVNWLIWFLEPDTHSTARSRAEDRSAYLFDTAIPRRTHWPWIDDVRPLPPARETVSNWVE